MFVSSGIRRRFLRILECSSVHERNPISGVRRTVAEAAGEALGALELVCEDLGESDVAWEAHCGRVAQEVVGLKAGVDASTASGVLRNGGAVSRRASRPSVKAADAQAVDASMIDVSGRVPTPGRAGCSDTVDHSVSSVRS